MTKTKIPKSVQQSAEEKWELLSRGEEPKSYTCSYCSYLKTCKECSLFPDICSVNPMDDGSLYWKWRKERNVNGASTNIAKKLASQIFKAVKDRAEVIDD